MRMDIIIVALRYLVGMHSNKMIVFTPGRCVWQFRLPHSLFPSLLLALPPRGPPQLPSWL